MTVCSLAIQFAILLTFLWTSTGPSTTIMLAFSASITLMSGERHDAFYIARRLLAVSDEQQYKPFHFLTSC
ncbi:hypothetical protein AS149_37535 [Burkholderia cenocepacia]|nr:hypothetical protein AS149_37535 [Burkholderia cenocepacia]